ncbi:MAG: NAD(P)-binding domain-containing protein [Chloroflexi bacterium]|nr:NAD(P)-binding domain-containing protein [Chloroflexota bacterium]
MTQITIIGTGRMAIGLGSAWTRAGHTITFGSRTPSAHGDLPAQIGPNAKITGHREAMRGAEIVVLAIPYREVESFARVHADALRGKIVIDISNPFKIVPDTRGAGAEITAAAIGAGARVIAAFKDNFANTLLEPADDQGRQRDVHFAGDDESAKRQFTKLVEDLGFRPVDCGALENARVLDGMVPLMVELDRRYKGNGRSSWKFML